MVTGDALDCSPESDCDVSASGAVWVDQFYDYCDTDRPGYQMWDEYLPGYPFNGNVFLDISDFAEKEIIFRFQSRYDADDDGGNGAGLFIDDLRIYKVSGGSYPPPTNLTGEGLDSSAELTWSDMNAAGTDDFIYDNDSFTNGITVTGESAWAGERIDLAGGSTINSISIFGSDLNTQADTTITVAVFGQFGSLFGNEPVHSTQVSVAPGQWSTVENLGWDMSNAYIIAHEFSGSFTAALDESAQGRSHSMVMLNAGWDNWADIAAGASLPDGEWGIRSNISYYGADVTYNVYVDGVLDGNAGSSNTTVVDGLTNNTTYGFSVSAVYSDGEESIQTPPIELTPQAQTVHEEYHDDGTYEETFNAGSTNFAAVKYSAIPEGEGIVRFKWFQEGGGGAFYVKVFSDDGGLPGEELESQVVAGGLVDGWNTKDLLSNGWNIAGDFWIGTKEFSSTMPFGLDTSSNSGNSKTRVGTAGEWTEIPGNLMIRVYLDCGANCGDTPPECTAGDINADGIINVLDIVSTVNFVLGTATPDDNQTCAADYNSDGIINVLDIVQLVNAILN